MDRFRPLTRAAALAPALLLVGAGCMTVDPADKSVKLTLPELPSLAQTAPSAPASQVLCFWQRRLAPLPDPTRDGMQTLGLPGQMFLVTPNDTPAEATCDLSVVVHDETPRPAGAPPRNAEYWHFTKDTLKKLVTTDERFGRCFALFLPWPPHWADVTHVRISTRYMSADRTVDIHGVDTRLVLDQPDPSRAGPPALGPGGVPAAYSTVGVPDPTKMLRQAAGGAVPVTPADHKPKVVVGAYAVPPPTSGQPSYGSYAPPTVPTVPLPTPPANPGLRPPLQPIIVGQPR